MSKLVNIADAGDDRVGDVVFVHGLGGAGRESWMADPKEPTSFWPRWIAEDIPKLRIRSLDYDASAFAWQGSPMSLSDRAKNALAWLDTRASAN